MFITNRQTYSLLDWLGDIGGLTDALLLILKIILYPYTVFTQRRFLLTNLFRFQATTPLRHDERLERDID